MKDKFILYLLSIALIIMLIFNIKTSIENKVDEKRIRYISNEFISNIEKVNLRYFNFKILGLNLHEEAKTLEKITKLNKAFNYEGIQDSFYLLKELNYLQSYLTQSNYHGDCSFDISGFSYSPFLKEYYFGSRDRFGNRSGVLQFFCNEIKIKESSHENVAEEEYHDHYKVKTADTLNLKLLKLQVNYLTGNIDTTIAERTVVYK